MHVRSCAHTRMGQARGAYHISYGAPLGSSVINLLPSHCGSWHFTNVHPVLSSVAFPF